MSTFTCNGTMTASGLGGETAAYKKLLFNLCKTGLTLSAIQIKPRSLFTIVINYTVAGSREDIEKFRRLVNDG